MEIIWTCWSDLAAVLRGDFLRRREPKYWKEDEGYIPYMWHWSYADHIADPHILLMMVSDLSMGRRTREEKTERSEVKVVSLLYSSSVQSPCLFSAKIKERGGGEIPQSSNIPLKWSGLSKAHKVPLKVRHTSPIWPFIVSLSLSLVVLNGGLTKFSPAGELRWPEMWQGPS